MDVRDDESFKAAAHAIVLGVILLPALYNLRIRKWTNVAVYAALIGFELTHVLSHLKDS